MLIFKITLFIIVFIDVEITVAALIIGVLSGFFWFEIVLGTAEILSHVVELMNRAESDTIVLDNFHSKFVDHACSLWILQGLTENYTWPFKVFFLSGLFQFFQSFFTKFICVNELD